MNPQFTFTSLPRDIVVQGIVPALAAEFQVFNVVSLGTASRALHTQCADLLAQLRGQRKLEGEGPLPMYSQLRVMLRAVKKHEHTPASRALNTILCQAWNGKGALLIGISGQGASNLNQLIGSSSQLGLAAMLKSAVEHAIEAQHDVLEVLIAAAGVQRSAGTDLGFQSLVVDAQLFGLAPARQIALLNASIGRVPYFSAGSVPLSPGVAGNWLDKQLESGQLEKVCSAPKRVPGEISPCLGLIEFVCRQFGPDSELRVPYFQKILAGLNLGNHISREDFQSLVAHLDSAPRASLQDWVDSQDRMAKIAHLLQSDFSIALDRIMPQIAVIRSESRLASVDLQRLDISQYLIPAQQAHSVQPDNSSNSSQAAKPRRKKRQKCSLM